MSNMLSSHLLLQKPKEMASIVPVHQEVEATGVMECTVQPHDERVLDLDTTHSLTKQSVPMTTEDKSTHAIQTSSTCSRTLRSLRVPSTSSSSITRCLRMAFRAMMRPELFLRT